MKQQKKSRSVTGKSFKKTLKNNKLQTESGAVGKPRSAVVVRNSPIHGRGVFAVQDIARGTRVLEYTGERMSHAEADRRYGELHDGSSHTMLFAVNEKVVIDATKRGGPARWINHSCSPNCESGEDDGRMFIEVIRAIRRGEELSYDYNLVLDERHTPKLKREHACCCGARKCRGTMLGSKR